MSIKPATIFFVASAMSHYPPMLPVSEGAWPPAKAKRKRIKGYQKKGNA